MSQDRPLPTTSYALLGLLSFGRELTGYELKQFADRTLRFYWTSPAMSQIYTELARLAERGWVDADERSGGERTTTHYSISDAGMGELRRWLRDSTPEFMQLKHPVALRLLLGHLVPPDVVRGWLETYLAQLDGQRAALREVLEGIEDDDRYAFPAHVARWGLAIYDEEEATTTGVEQALDERRVSGRGRRRRS